MTTDALAAPQIESYLTRLWKTTTTVANLARIPGGASRETYRFDATANGETRQLILRREPAAGLIDTESETEFRAYQSAHGVVPVPRAVALEQSGAELGRAFFVMERVEGGEVAGSFARDPFGEHAEALGGAFFAALGRLAAFDPAGTPLAAHVATPAPGDCWRVALDYWEGVIDEDASAPLPIVRAAIRRLRAHPPPPAQAIRIVHGDWRSGNVMHDGAGRMLGMFDWEMAHLGDPLEDLGWALDPIWDHFDAGRVCGMTTRETAIAVWERASGMIVDPAALAWWSLFNSVKGRAIWTSAFKEFVAGGLTDPVLGISGWYTAVRQDAIIADQLASWSDLPPSTLRGEGRGEGQCDDQAVSHCPSPDLAALGHPLPGAERGIVSDLAQILTGSGMIGIGAGTARVEHDAFGGATLLVAGVLALLGAQEVEQAAAWRIADLAAMRALFGEAAPALAGGFTLTELDADWAAWSEALIAFHSGAEVRGDGDADRAICGFYRESAARRTLTWPI